MALFCQEDIVYQFPRADNKVIASRGMFITLAGTVFDATGSTIHRYRFLLCICKRVLLECPQWSWTWGSVIIIVPFDRITKKNCKISFELENKEMRQNSIDVLTSN